MVKIGVIANNERLNELVTCIHSLDNARLSGICCESTTTSDIQPELFVDDYEQLIQASDAIYIGPHHEPTFDIIQHAFRHGKHVFLEQVAALSVEEIMELLSHRKEANVKCLTGSFELSHPAFHAARKLLKNPLLIESNREVLFSANDTKNIILDVMLKDLAVIMNLVPGEIKRIAANGFKIMNGVIDMATCRLEFSNGCVAILTVNKSGASANNQFRIYEEHQQLTLDLSDGSSSSLIRTSVNDGILNSEAIQIDHYQPLTYQINNFIESISAQAEPMFKLREAYKKVDIATRILKKINSFGEE